ncbi:MAG: hypothetical protein WEB53_09960 [Akkermansiaceae bacterium]
MKINCVLVLALLLSTSSIGWSHGPAHAHRATERSTERAAANETLGLQETAIPVEDADSADRWWGVNVTTGWESRHVHYGVDESGPTGAYVNEVGVQLGDLSISVWNGIGTGNSLSEWDFTVAYNIDLGPVFIVPGYNLRYVPSYPVSGDDHGAEEHGEEDHAEEGGDDHEGHAHNTIGNELFISVGTTLIPYVIPSANFIWDLNNNPGGFMELRLDGNVPVYADTVSLQPYALLGLNFGYNNDDYSGWNNFQFGLQATYALTEYLSVFAGVNYSVALEALQQINQEDVVWANVGLSFAY